MTFKDALLEFMLNTSDYLENEKQIVLNRVSLNHLNASDYYDLLVTEVRADYARHIFRKITAFMKDYK